METAKQKAIREAYGENFEKCNPDENGWVKYYKCKPETTGLNSLAIDRDIVEGEYRLISLRFIETNRGWTRIESDKDFPNDDKEYWIIENGKINKRVIPESRSAWWINNVTHFQPIINPEPPIY